MCPKRYSTILLLLLFIEYTRAKLTQEQIDKTAEMMRGACQPKFKVSDALVDGIKSGEFPDEKPLKCYVNCVMEMMLTMKKGKIAYESAIRQMDLLLPDAIVDDFKSALEKCKGSATGIKDHCLAAYTALECFYKNNPKFFFP